MTGRTDTNSQPHPFAFGISPLHRKPSYAWQPPERGKPNGKCALLALEVIDLMHNTIA